MDLDEDAEEDEDEDIEEEAEEEEDEEEDEDMDLESTASPRSPATYPNTVPFFHAPRIPNLPPPPINTTHPSLRRASGTNIDRPRTLSFGAFGDAHNRSHGERAARQSFSSFSSTPADGRSIQIVSSLPIHQRSGSMSSTQGSESGRRLARRASIHKNHRPSSAILDSRVRSSARTGNLAVPVEPRILISNNDQTVKVFSLRADPDASAPPGGARSSNAASIAAGLSAAPIPDPSTRLDESLTPNQRRQRDLATMDRVLNSISRQVLPPVPTFYGGRLGWDSVGLNEGIRANATAGGTTGGSASRGAAAMSSSASPPSMANRARQTDVDSHANRANTYRARTEMNVDLNHVPMRDSDIRTAIEEEREEERKLSRVGGARFKTAINHCGSSLTW